MSGYNAKSEERIERATELLFHYFEIVLPPADHFSKSDTRAELRECVRAIVDAAEYQIQETEDARHD